MSSSLLPSLSGLPVFGAKVWELTLKSYDVFFQPKCYVTDWDKVYRGGKDWIWQLDVPLADPVTVSEVLVFALVGLFLLRIMMCFKSKPFNLRKVSAAHYLLLSGASLYIGLSSVRDLYYRSQYQPLRYLFCVTSISQNYGHSWKLVYLYYLTKFYDFCVIETLSALQKHRFDIIRFTVNLFTLSMVFSWLEDRVVMANILISISSLVHFCMYSYWYTASMEKKQRPWAAGIITLIQFAQIGAAILIMLPYVYFYNKPDAFNVAEITKVPANTTRFILGQSAEELTAFWNNSQDLVKGQSCSGRNSVMFTFCMTMVSMGRLAYLLKSMGACGSLKTPIMGGARGACMQVSVQKARRTKLQSKFRLVSQVATSNIDSSVTRSYSPLNKSMVPARPNAIPQAFVLGSHVVPPSPSSAMQRSSEEPPMYVVRPPSTVASYVTNYSQTTTPTGTPKKMFDTPPRPEIENRSWNIPENHNLHCIAKAA